MRQRTKNGQSNEPKMNENAPVGKSTSLETIKRSYIKNTLYIMPIHQKTGIGIKAVQIELRKIIARSPKVPNLLMRSRVSIIKLNIIIKKVSLSGHPKTNVSHLRHLGTLRPQPCEIFCVISQIPQLIKSTPCGVYWHVTI